MYFYSSYMRLTVTEMYDKLKDEELDQFLTSMVSITMDRSYNKQYSSDPTEGTKMHAIMLTEWKNNTMLTKHTKINNESIMEYYMEMPFMNHVIVGQPDVINKHEIIDYKCGSLYKANRISCKYLFQLEMYAFMVHTQMKRNINRIILFNPFTNHIIKMNLNSKFISSFKHMLQSKLDGLSQ